MFRILHFADLHLDASFAASGLPTAVGSWRRVDLNSTLERILSLAREREVDAVTIAGDLFEQEYTLPDTLVWLKQQFTQLAPIRVFIAPGESDPYSDKSLYTLIRWPENVTIFSRRWLTAVELAPDIHLWGAAHPPTQNRRRFDHFQVDQDGTNLLLLHAIDLAEEQAKQTSTFLIDLASIEAAGFDFALLGHQHTARLWPEEAPRCIYPGSPEPLTLEQSGEANYVALLTIEAGVCTPELIPVGQWRYLSLEVDLTGCDSTEAVTNRTQESLQATENSNEERSIYYVTFTGKPNFDLDIEALYDRVESKAYIHYRTDLSMTYDLKQLIQEPTTRGLLVRNFQSRLENATSEQERRFALTALDLALRSLDGRKVQFNEIK